MDGVGWKTARLSDVPGATARPGFSRDAYFRGMEERAPHILARWKDAGERFASDHRTTHDVRGFLGVESFGVNAFRARGRRGRCECRVCAAGGARGAAPRRPNRPSVGPRTAGFTDPDGHVWELAEKLP
ncbi:MAG TPA: hypothetical protein VK874_15705 [Gaiellaceae bacterium]|nr:hypothetical protein [Gaiellaceae bacterium]